MLQADKIKQKYLASKQRVERKFDENGKLKSVSVFKDVNKDGKEDLFSVTVYQRNADGTVFERMVIDSDGDGYNDYQKDVVYKKGKKIQEKEHLEEKIDSVKNRENSEASIFNRKMVTHLNGNYRK